MAEIERLKVIPLDIPLEDERLKARFEQLTLKAPTLAQAEQFYTRQASTNSLSAMRLMIALVSEESITETTLQKMDFIDFRRCEVYLLGFLTWKSSPTGKTEP